MSDSNLAVLSKPRARALLYPGCTARFIGHTELSVNPTTRPVDCTRWPIYDQHEPVAVLAHCPRLKAMGMDLLEYNSYSIGGVEDTALKLYWKATQQAGLNQMSNIDKGIYDGKATPAITLIQQYINY